LDISRKFKASIHNFRFNSLLIRNFLFTLPLLLLPLIGIEVKTYMTSYSVTQDNIAESSLHSLMRVRDFMENIITDSNRIAAKISLDDNVRVFMLSPSIDLQYNANLNKDVLKAINMYMDVFSYIDSVYIFSESSQSVIHNQNGLTGEAGPDEQIWYTAYKQKTELQPAVVPRIRTSNFPYIITVLRPVSLDKKNWIGSIEVNLDTGRLSQYIGQVEGTNAENIFVVGKDGTILYNRDLPLMTENISKVPGLSDIALSGKQFYDIKTVEGKKSIITGILSENENRWYISIVPMENFLQKFASLKHLYLILILLGAAASVVIAFFISYRSFRPISTIISIIETQDDTKQNKALKLKANEVKYIVDSIMKIIYSNKVFVKELEQRITSLNKAQAVALQSQITPHFLFNTLENINLNAIVLLGEQNKVSAMISNLSEMLRIVMDAKTQLIPIKNEVEHVKYFIEIMKARYGDKIVLVWDLQDVPDDCMIPKICIQPLVENAIQHGLQSRRRKGTITIRGWWAQERIIIEVADDGIGMEADTVARLNESFANGDIFESEHIGISNVNQRLKLIFGDPFGLIIISGKDIGTTVSLHFPIMRRNAIDQAGMQP
jgi:two-component system sensor histidine kinase YesM